MILKLSLNTWMLWLIFIKMMKEYNASKKRKVLIVFDEMIAGMLEKT